MLFALDIETIPNPDKFDLLPEPEAAKNIKDPAKIEADIDAKRVAQREKAALDPMFGRVAAVAFVGEIEEVIVIEDASDEAERLLVGHIMVHLAKEGARIITFNGIEFDIPYIYMRALILGVHPAAFGAPPLTHWTQRYRNDYHYDLLKIVTGWRANSYVKLDTIARLVLGRGKIDLDVTQIAEMIKTEEGRAKVGGYCKVDTDLPWDLFAAMEGCLFA